MELHSFDVIIIGGGAAGSRAAYEAKKTAPELRVGLLLLGKYGVSGSSNLIASEWLGINAPLNRMEDGDSPDIFYHDIIETGGGLSDPELAGIISREANLRIQDLIELGVAFDSDSGGVLQFKLSGCTKARSLTCQGSTGRAIVSALKKANTAAGVEIIEDFSGQELLLDSNGEVCGIAGFIKREPVIFSAGAVVMATGGAGRLFSEHVNPPFIAGDGWAMALRAGAVLTNLEFFQIGPAVAYPPMQYIIHSKMWRLMPVLTNSNGDRFLQSYLPEGVTEAEVLDKKAMSYPFSVRTAAKYCDIAIFKEITEGRGFNHGGVEFDLTHVPETELLEKIPVSYQTLKKTGVDLAKDKIELKLVVQNFNGGILIDENAETTVRGLFAAGEVSGGVHGSDRPGGNNLIDTQVFGARAGRFAAELAKSKSGKAVKTFPENIGQDLLAPEMTEMEKNLSKELGRRYFETLTIIRKAGELENLVDFIRECRKKTRSGVIDNQLIVGEAIAMAELNREESRGTHYREDFPDEDQDQLYRLDLSLSENEGFEVKRKMLHETGERN